MKIAPYADTLVQTIQQLLIADPDQRDKAFAVTLRAYVEDHDKLGSVRAVRGFVSVCVVAAASPKVYASFSDRPRRFLEMDWHLICCHDSAWKDDGVRSVLVEATNAVIERAKVQLGLNQGRKPTATAIGVHKMALTMQNEVIDPELCCVGGLTFSWPNHLDLV